MTDFKIGDRVCFRSAKDAPLGYVSSVFKGHLFTLTDPEIRVHIGNGIHIICNASDLEVFEDE